MIILFLLILFIIFVVFQPWIERLHNGDIILWYNVPHGYGRAFIILFKGE